MPVLVSLHLGQAQDSVLTFAAVIVGLLGIVDAACVAAILSRRVFLEPSCYYRVHLLVHLPVGHYFVGVSTVVVTLQAVEVTGTLLIRTCKEDCKSYHLRCDVIYFMR